MLRSIKELEKYDVKATDGDIGSIENFYFDDTFWTIRYVVVDVDTGEFFTDRSVLISPIMLGEIETANKRLNVKLSREKVKNSPSYDSKLPISRRYERDYFGYYGWPFYWGANGVWGAGDSPGMLGAAVESGTGMERNREIVGRSTKAYGEDNNDFHLQSTDDVIGYKIHGRDDEIGHVDNFIIDDKSWTIRYLVIDTSNWWFGKKVLISPQWADKIDWQDKKVYLSLRRDHIKNSPEWTDEMPIDRPYETELHQYYKRPEYWKQQDIR